MMKNSVLLFRTLREGIPNCRDDQGINNNCHRRKLCRGGKKKTEEAISKSSLRIQQAIIAHG